MKLHPKILELSNVIKAHKPNTLLSIETLNILLEHGATATEAAITLHLGFDIEDEEASKFVLESHLFPPEEINDSAYATFTYMYYDETGEE